MQKKNKTIWLVIAIVIGLYIYQNPEKFQTFMGAVGFETNYGIPELGEGWYLESDWTTGELIMPGIANSIYTTEEHPPEGMITLWCANVPGARETISPEAIRENEKYYFEGQVKCKHTYKNYVYPVEYKLPIMENRGTLQIKPNTITGFEQTLPSTFTLKKDFKGNDLKIRAYQYSQDDARINIGGAEAIKRATTSSQSSGHHYESFIVEVKSYVDTEKVDIYLDGQFSSSTDLTGKPLKISFKSIRDDGAGMLVDYIISKPLYSCLIRENDVVVRDKFAPNSIVNQDTITYKTWKFCPEDYSPKIRNFDTNRIEGRASKTRFIIDRIIRGEEYVVKNNEALEIYYITPYVTSMTERCNADVGEFYDTESEACIGLIEQYTQVLQCLTVSDCPEPCTGKTTECIDNECTYQGECLVQPIPEVNLWNLITSIWNDFWNWINSLSKPTGG